MALRGIGAGWPPLGSKGSQWGPEGAPRAFLKIELRWLVGGWVGWFVGVWIAGLVDGLVGVWLGW